MKRIRTLFFSVLVTFVVLGVFSCSNFFNNSKVGNFEFDLTPIAKQLARNVTGDQDIIAYVTIKLTNLTNNEVDQIIKVVPIQINADFSENDVLNKIGSETVILDSVPFGKYNISAFISDIGSKDFVGVDSVTKMPYQIKDNIKRSNIYLFIATEQTVNVNSSEVQKITLQFRFPTSSERTHVANLLLLEDTQLTFLPVSEKTKFAWVNDDTVLATIWGETIEGYNLCYEFNSTVTAEDIIATSEIILKNDSTLTNLRIIPINEIESAEPDIQTFSYVTLGSNQILLDGDSSRAITKENNSIENFVFDNAGNLFVLFTDASTKQSSISHYSKTDTGLTIDATFNLSSMYSYLAFDKYKDKVWAVSYDHLVDESGSSKKAQLTSGKNIIVDDEIINIAYNDRSFSLLPNTINWKNTSVIILAAQTFESLYPDLFTNDLQLTIEDTIIVGDYLYVLAKQQFRTSTTQASTEVYNSRGFLVRFKKTIIDSNTPYYEFDENFGTQGFFGWHPTANIIESDITPTSSGTTKKYFMPDKSSASSFAGPVKFVGFDTNVLYIADVGYIMDGTPTEVRRIVKVGLDENGSWLETIPQDNSVDFGINSNTLRGNFNSFK